LGLPPKGELCKGEAEVEAVETVQVLEIRVGEFVDREDVIVETLRGT